MKKILTVLLIALLALTVLGVTGVLLFRHFVADQIMDKGGMMNPDYTDGTDDVYILDGDHTYVDNEKLLQVIMGTWSSEDGHYTIKLIATIALYFGWMVSRCWMIISNLFIYSRESSSLRSFPWTPVYCRRKMDLLREKSLPFTMKSLRKIPAAD